MQHDAIAKSQSTEDQDVYCGRLSDRRERWTPQRLRELLWFRFHSGYASFFGSDGLTMDGPRAAARRL